MRRSALLLVLLVVAGCTARAAGDGRLHVVAAESFWGSLAAQLGGDRVRVTSLVHTPGADPHDYEPTASDARAMATAKLAIVNGVGYDPWAQKLIDANPAGGRVVLNVGDLVGASDGGNPHRWYSPPDVQRVIDAITASYKRLAPGDARYFDSRRAVLESRLAGYRALIASIRERAAGVPVGASESVFQPLAAGLGLRLITPAGFMNAVSEGADPSASDRSTVDRQISSRQIRLWVYNGQNATPDVNRLTDEARSAGVPVVTVSETPEPASASFQDWQVRQLRQIERALG